ncbi:MAG: hypothetical protein COB53_02265 [Elusimicrobia bacterium]|nr:MAG: hypothetical protein COB53_02265 [Elusimicrobiota bacterium]
MKISILPVLLFLPVCASANIRPPAPILRHNLSPEVLDRIFDGKVVPVENTPVREQRKILYAESESPPAAPRFALDLDTIPVEFRDTIAGFDRLPHKNQEETPEQVAKINDMIRRQNQGRRFGKIKEWTYDGRPNEPIWTCLAHAAASANDWWAQQLGRSLPQHESRSHGGNETGLDPTLLELEYFRRSRISSGNGDPDFVVPPKFIQKDPVRNTGFPYEPRGYAKLLTEKKSYTVKDPISGKVFTYKPEMSAMEGEWKQLFTNSVFRGRTPLKYAKVLKEGLQRWGIAYVQLEHTEHPRWPGAHAVAVVGYFCMEQGERLIHCSTNQTDKDWGEKTYFIAHDSFGKFPASLPRTANSASAYRAVRITSIDQAIVFPHGLKLDVSPRPGVAGAWGLRVTNTAGIDVIPSAVKALGADGIELTVQSEADGSFFMEGEKGDALRIYIEAPYYHARNGLGRGFVIELDDALRSAVPIRQD